MLESRLASLEEAHAAELKAAAAAREEAVQLASDQAAQASRPEGPGGSAPPPVQLESALWRRNRTLVRWMRFCVPRTCKCDGARM